MPSTTTSGSMQLMVRPRSVNKRSHTRQSNNMGRGGVRSVRWVAWRARCPREWLLMGGKNFGAWQACFVFLLLLAHPYSSSHGSICFGTDFAVQLRYLVCPCARSASSVTNWNIFHVRFNSKKHLQKRPLLWPRPYVYVYPRLFRAFARLAAVHCA